MEYDKALQDVQDGVVSEDTLDALKYRDLNRPFRGGTITSDDPIKEKEFIDFMNSEWAVVRSGSSANIMGVVSDADPDELTFHLLTQQAFKIATANYVQVFDANRSMNGADYWLKHPQRREYTGIIFDPTGGRTGYYNLYRGFSVIPEEGDCDLYLELVREIICAGNVEATEYVLNWLAHIIQRPTEKPETALVLRGRQGTGKTSFAGIFGYLLGRHYIEESDMERVFGRFNASMADKLLILVDEGLWGGDRSKVGKLKTFITQKRITIEKKGIDPITLPHHGRLIIASNETWAVHADQDDRRFVFLDVSDAKAQDTTYFSALYSQLEEGGDSALLHCLLTRDITDWNSRQRPNTGFGQDVREASMTSSQRFWFKVLQEGEALVMRIDIHGNDVIESIHHATEDWESIPKEQVYHAYTKECRENRERHTAIEQEFWGSLYKMLGATNKEDKDAFDGGKKTFGSKRYRCIRLLPLESLRRMYDNTNQVSTEWESVDSPDTSSAA